MSAVEYLHHDVVIVGTGMTGSALASQFANNGKSVLIIDKNEYIGGNAADTWDQNKEVYIPKAGSHTFSTSDESLWKYVNSITPFTMHHTASVVHHSSVYYPFDFSLDMLSKFWRTELTEETAKEMIALSTITLKDDRKPRNAEEYCLSVFGKALYDAFLRQYLLKTYKGVNPRKLSVDTVSHFTLFNKSKPTYSGFPQLGWTRFFEKLLDHANIEIMLNTDFDEIKPRIKNSSLIIYTGPVDGYFNHKCGYLNWRSSLFQNENVYHMSNYDIIPALVINHNTHDHDAVRTFQPEFVVNQTIPSIVQIVQHEYYMDVSAKNPPLYAVNQPVDKKIMARYRKMIRAHQKTHNTFFAGRCGTYHNITLDEALAEALVLYKKLKRKT